MRCQVVAQNKLDRLATSGDSNIYKVVLNRSFGTTYLFHFQVSNLTLGNEIDK